MAVNDSGLEDIQELRFPTGVAGLDTLLHGGLIRGAVTIVQGAPGAGKTILASQVAFNHARGGGSVLYVTVLAESHGRLTAQLRNMDFFDGQALSQSIHYISGFDTLETDGIRGILRLLGEEARLRQATLIVLDGLFVLEESCDGEGVFRRFINDLAVQAELMRCTMLLLTNSRRQPSSPEYTMVDGWIELGRSLMAHRTLRHIEVHKLRGSDFISGLHMLSISDAGVGILPRLEAVVGSLEPKDDRIGVLASGIPDFDTMLGGGVPRGSTTLLFGPSGVGKTTLGLHFLAQCTPEEPGLFLCMYETPERLIRKGRSLGLPIDDLVASGALQLEWHSPADSLLDTVGYAVLEKVKTRAARRLFIDGMAVFERSVVFADRVPQFLMALTNQLRHHGCTSMFTAEAATLVGGETRMPFGSISAIAENIVLMRYIEQDASLKRSLGLVKVRESGFDPAVREFSIGDTGIRIGPPLRVGAVG